MKQVLIAEDNDDLREIFARTFDKSNFEVHVVIDGQAAIERLQTDVPDVLILDVNMPRMTGIDVLAFVRDNIPKERMKIILVTGNPLAAHAPETEIADLFLVKPVSIHDLRVFAQRLSSL